ncbi:MAG: extracellular solute-binding protein [Oscillospiraceae bacterium]
MFKKTLAMILSVATVFGMTACSKPAVAPTSSETPSSKAEDFYDLSKLGDLGGLTLPLSEEPTTLEWLVISDKTDLDTKFFAEEFKKISNIEIKFTAIPNTGAKEKVATIIASKKLPDVIGGGLDVVVANKIGPQGALVALNDKLDIMPNFKAMVEKPKYSYYLKTYAAADSKVYSAISVGASRDINHGMLYRKDIFDKHGIKPWTNTEEFYQALTKLKELYPKSTPFTYKSNKNFFLDFGYSWGLQGFEMYYNEAAKAWKLSTSDPEFKNMLDFTKKCYDEGLFDPEFLTLTPEQWTTKMTSDDQAFITFDWVDRMNIFKGQTKESNPNYDLRYGFPVGPTGQQRNLGDFSGYSTSIAAGPKADIACKAIDFMYSDAGAQLQTLGIEGVTYKINETTGKADYLGFEADKIIGINDLEAQYGLFQQCVYRTIDRRSNYFTFSEQTQEAQDIMIKENRIAALDPQLGFSEEDTAKIVELKPELMKKGEEFAFQYILSGPKADTDKLWADWIKAVKGYGEDELTEIYNRTQKTMFGE